MTIKTPIIPQKQTFAKVQAPHEVNQKAICVFAATGFFLDTDTYWKDQVVLPAAAINKLDDNGFLLESKPWFQWYNAPKERPFQEVVEEFSELFKTIVSEQIAERSVILPLSGGLDSRTQAIVLKELQANVQAYSYQFEQGYNETRIAKQVANQCGFSFDAFTIPKGYLWDKIDAMLAMNQGYSDFCSPRQLAILNQLKSYQGVFSLGHWGDVLFDDMGVAEDSTIDEQTQQLIKKIVKRGGLKLAQTLWQAWQLEGNFYDYFYARIQSLLQQIDIPHSANARLRAFKSLYWAPQWTSINLSVFEAAHPITLPYYDDRMCKFICEIPERYLSARQIQIAYIKQKAPDLAKLTWELYHPCNLYNYKRYYTYKGLPGRLQHSLQYRVKRLFGKPTIQRNWELQFLGKDNDNHLQQALFSDEFKTLVPIEVTETTYNGFKSENQLHYAHGVNMLLTLAKWYSKST
ncbi:asparagine synthase-related protein [Mangrovimonas spongiae]|uniref:asparagine synthase (glutamine-hydrolyzing) n=1 Tax=Mangrovimonas spongiae TaxID=2494697 RepID=A0A428K261_9FLAO|nr:asparagine synthase-related protein [Mangrovimonas spongiae]RSK40500.1 asparagine synthetase B family protein [Mangrovimonas spongiae]